MSTLEALRKHSIIVADTADLRLLQEQSVTDATTNPSLILAAAQTPGYNAILEEGRAKQAAGEPIQRAVQRILALAGSEILKIIPGRVSAEVDARLSFDTQATIRYAYDILEEFTQLGVDSNRVLIKIAGTWEGLAAARYLEAQGIHCNITLIFHLEQAIAAAENGATLISPFVGRILDFYKQQDPSADFTGDNDPGVQSVKEIYRVLKRRQYPTEIMAASFRNIDEIVRLAGCDLLTISPKLLSELADNNTQLQPTLGLSQANHAEPVKLAQDPRREAQFRWQMNNDPMSHTKLAEGIRKFTADQLELEQLICR